MKTDDRGFTLVELIVSIVILAIVAAAAFGFMVAGAKSYTNVGDRLDLQMRAKVASSQITERLLDCNGAVYYANNNLYIANTAKNGDKYTNTVYIYTYDAAAKTITYAKVEATNDTAPISALDTYKTDTPTTSVPLAENVSGFSVTFTPNTDKSPTASAALTISFAKATATLSTQKTVALRNRPKYITITSGT